jgi:hypothetical protein
LRSGARPICVATSSKHARYPKSQPYGCDPQQEAAIRLYQSLGFSIYGTEQETFSLWGYFYDEHLMTLKLNPENDRNA